ncbi:MAG: hypothetical protein MPW15_15620 [Candidatus Manganitrophus sp.]|nr:hypothetical protein [Candidatus Manganitrophus sp.]
METTARLASLLSAIEYYQLGLDYFEKYPNYIKKVTQNDVLRVAKKYLDPEHYALVVVAKQSEANVKEPPAPPPVESGAGAEEKCP